MTQVISSATVGDTSGSITPTGVTFVQVDGTKTAEIDVEVRVDDTAAWRLLERILTHRENFVRYPQFPRMRLTIAKNPNGDTVVVSTGTI